ncbi:hypothetical protein GLYMA_05G009800v4 [Glycine max]|uniref:uncharacterized protein n=1 Tax=Glycine max TaxID=3847 RepID=UPI001B3571B6|nr:uncharacterized protein LOC121174940 [Glycine max]KAH1132234.1 hypothetical protein GYH30_011211 [Glycine max]KRH56640.2 hypothetical protein GLYMA_05G009800v4 [Glycine max]
MLGKKKYFEKSKISFFEWITSFVMSSRNISFILAALCSCLLPESLQVTSVKQLPEYHECSEDKFVESLSPATPRESTEIDEEQEKHLLSPSDGTEDAHFVKEDASEISGVFEVRNNTGPSSV